MLEKILGSTVARRLMGTVVHRLNHLEAKGEQDIPARFVVATAFAAVGYGCGYASFCVYEVMEKMVKNVMGRA